MEIKDYFENTKGTGVISTADSQGKVNSAIYSRPHVFDDGTWAFIMRDRLTHHNLASNPHACFLFKEDGPGYNGKRFHLTKLREEENSELVKTLRRRQYSGDETATRFLVVFRVDTQLPLIGSGD
jgi:hypothetical protein